jgi:hypothetical protein
MITEDPAVFMQDWGRPAQLGGVDVLGLFADPAVHAGLGGPGMTSSQPSYWLPTASVPADVESKQLVVPASDVHPGGTYTVEQHLPDGTGFSLLYLALVRA